MVCFIFIFIILVFECFFVVVFFMWKVVIKRCIRWLIVLIWIVFFVYLVLFFYVVKVFFYDGILYCVEDWVFVFDLR